MVILGCIAALATAWTLLILQVDPVPVWFYVFAWYPTLVLVDEVIAKRAGTTPVRRRPLLAVSLLGWSAVVWLLFEAFNFRLQNWYYVMLPAPPVERWAGIVISFATVVPAVILAERLLATFGLGYKRKASPVKIRPWELRAATVIGVAAGTASLGWPSQWFPLIWGAAWLLVDPWLYRRHPEWSLLGDLARGHWGRIVRLLTGGLLIGFLWEGYNYWARGKWIYTVPGLESVKFFEMPPLGFLGFPVFALEAWTLYHALCALGVAVPFDPPRITHRIRRAASVGAVAVGIAFSVVTLSTMERMTISSTAPRLADLPGITPEEASLLRRADVGSPWQLASRSARQLSERTGLSLDDATRILDATRLTLLRGLGAGYAAQLNTLGVNSICQLARRDPAELYESFARRRGDRPRPTEAEVRVWVRAASRRCDFEASSG